MRRLVLLLPVLQIALLISSCFFVRDEIAGDSVSVNVEDGILMIKANQELVAIELLLDGIIETKYVIIPEKFLHIISYDADKTRVSIVRPFSNIYKGELLAEIDSEFESLSFSVLLPSSFAKLEKGSLSLASFSSPELLGDFDSNGEVSLTDFINFARVYNTTSFDEKYNEPFDIAPAEDYFSGAWSNIFDVCTPDGEISLLDFVIFARNYGKTEPEQIVYSIEGTITPYFELSDSFHESSKRSISFTNKEIEQGFMSNQFVVLFDRGFDSTIISDVSGVEILDEFFSRDGSVGYAVVKTDDLSSLSGIEGVKSVEPEKIFTLQSEESVPNDPHYPKQWNYPMIQMPQAWTIAKGSSTVVVAVIDSGTRPDHPDLSGRLLSGYDVYNDDNDPIDEPPAGKLSHGTHVTGTIASSTDNLVGVSGMIWSSYPVLLPVKVFEYDEYGRSVTTESILAKGIHYAVDHGAKIINMSLAGPDSSVVAAAVQYASENEVLMIAASGNYSSSSPYYPASYEEVISVGAVDITMQRANYSNYGPYLDLVAPGGSSSVQILSTGYSANEGNTYSYMAGTSMAAPHVTGLAALLMAEGYAGKDDSGEEIIRKILRETALDLGENGWDPYYGFGLVQAYDALATASEEKRPFIVEAINLDGQVLRTAEVSESSFFSLENLSDYRIRLRVWRDVNGNAIIDKGDLLGYAGYYGLTPNIEESKVLSFEESGTYSLESTITFAPVF